MTTLLSHPSIQAVPLRDNGEPLVEVDTGLGGCVRVRAGVAERLVIARALLPAPYTLVVLEGHRSAARQMMLERGYLAQLSRSFPTLSENQLRVLSSRAVAPLSVAPHVAGAAVDVTIIDPRGRIVDMGSEVDATPEECDMRCFTGAQNISRAARANRTMLADAMRGAGFVNYPTEWWHWSFGDRYWAHQTDMGHALYGPIEREELACTSA